MGKKKKISGKKAEKLFPFILEKAGFQFVDPPIPGMKVKAIARANSFEDHSLKIDFWINYDLGEGFIWIPVQFKTYGKTPTSPRNSVIRSIRKSKYQGILCIAIKYDVITQAHKGDKKKIQLVGRKVKHAIERHFPKIENPFTLERAIYIKKCVRDGGNKNNANVDWKKYLPSNSEDA